MASSKKPVSPSAKAAASKAAASKAQLSRGSAAKTAPSRAGTARTHATSSVAAKTKSAAAGKATAASAAGKAKLAKVAATKSAAKESARSAARTSAKAPAKTAAKTSSAASSRAAKAPAKSVASSAAKRSRITVATTKAAATGRISARAQPANAAHKVRGASKTAARTAVASKASAAKTTRPERAAAKAATAPRGSTVRSPKHTEPTAKAVSPTKPASAKIVAATRPEAARVSHKVEASKVASAPIPSAAPAALKSVEATDLLNDQSKVTPKISTGAANPAAPSQLIRQQAPARDTAGAVAAPAASHDALAKDDAVKSSTTTKEPVKTEQGAMATAPAQAAVAPAKPVEKAAPKPGTHRTGFKANEFIVYPAHGVGQILAIEEQEVAGFKLELFVINFTKDKMTLKVPLPKVLAGAIRKLADAETVQKALETLTGRARVKRTMWSRRAQEYEAKINSGDLHSIAEVVRDLYRSDAQPEQSYSERQLYEAALDRMAREIAAVQKLTETEALKLIEAQLQKGPRRGGKADAEADPAEGDADTDPDGDVEEAA